MPLGEHCAGKIPASGSGLRQGICGRFPAWVRASHTVFQYATGGFRITSKNEAEQAKVTDKFRAMENRPPEEPSLP
jgi:hypothetical protein